MYATFAFQLLQHIYGEARFPAPGQLREAAICLADELTPASFWNWIKRISKGCCCSGGTTSHTVILARSFNIPTLVGVD